MIWCTAALWQCSASAVQCSAALWQWSAVQCSAVQWCLGKVQAQGNKESGGGGESEGVQCAVCCMQWAIWEVVGDSDTSNMYTSWGFLCTVQIPYGSVPFVFIKIFIELETWMTLSSFPVLKFASGGDTFTQVAKYFRLHLRNSWTERTTKPIS